MTDIYKTKAGAMIEKALENARADITKIAINISDTAVLKFPKLVRILGIKTSATIVIIELNVYRIPMTLSAILDDIILDAESCKNDEFI